MLNRIETDLGARLDPEHKGVIEQLSMHSAPRNIGESLIRYLYEAENFVRFTGGFLRYRPQEEPIQIVQFGFQSEWVSAVVEGDSEDAYLLCAYLVAQLWESAGMRRSWEEIESRAISISYQTTTLARLGRPIRALFSPELRAFLGSLSARPNGFASQMGTIPYEPIAREKENLHADSREAVVFGDSINLIVSVFDRSTGRAEDARLNIKNASRSELNRGVVLVTSELPSSRHESMVDELIRSVRQ